MLKRSLPWEMDYDLVGTFPFLLKSTQESAKDRPAIVRFPKRFRQRGIICTWSSEGYLLMTTTMVMILIMMVMMMIRYSKSISTWSSEGYLLNDNDNGDNTDYDGVDK